MIWDLVHWAALIGATYAAFLYFRDLGDVTQALMTVKRSDMMFAIRNEHRLIGLGLTMLAVALSTHFLIGAGSAYVLYPAAIAVAIMIGFPWIWLHLGLRHQQSTARYYSIDQAGAYVRPEESVIVIENNGVARAHPDHHIKRPHLAGTPDGLGGENVIMTYCCMTHLGLGYKPAIGGEPLDLEVIAQHGNNLIMKDRGTGEPIQQVYGTRECDGRNGPGMTPWPTFRMSFRGFAKAYPNGEVFLNMIVPFKQNPLLCAFDNLVEAIFLWATTPHHQSDSLLFDTMEHEDDRLPRKTLVWGLTVGGEAGAFTEDFVREADGIVNTQVGGRKIVLAYDVEHDSLGAFYNDTAEPVTEIDVFGRSNAGTLPRIETLQAGLYWFVWVNYFPNTQLNYTDARTGMASEIAA